MATQLQADARSMDKLRRSVVLTREVGERQREIQLTDALLANYQRPSRPTYRMMGGTVRFVGKVKHYSMADVIDGPLTYAVRKEMHCRGIGDLCNSNFEGELVDVARAALLGTEAPFEAQTYDEAARKVVTHTIDAEEHKAERIHRAVQGAEGWSWS